MDKEAPGHLITLVPFGSSAEITSRVIRACWGEGTWVHT